MIPALVKQARDPPTIERQNEFGARTVAWRTFALGLLPGALRLLKGCKRHERLG
jgi:hypothetical protein